MYQLHFAYSHLFFITLPVLALLVAYRLWWYKRPVYRYALTQTLANSPVATSGIHHKVFFGLRLAQLLLLCFLVARPQWVDKNSTIHGEGRDIVLALDVSGSMELFDDERDRRSRIQVAKEEAISFIDKRTDDPIGVVIFARDALSRCPITLDKAMLKSIVGQLSIGFINEQGTSLGTGLATAVNRLRKSKSKSKIIILLTDGEPTPETDRISPETAIDLAKQFGIKVYTIGIGSEQGGIVKHPFYGYQRVQARINVPLLKEIASNTGGQFFRANNPSSMKQIYSTIDALEKTEYTTTLFQNSYEAFIPFMIVLLLLVFLELFCKLFLWRGV